MPIERFDTENFNENEENLLEYMRAVADRIAPDFMIDPDGNAIAIDSQAPFIFKRRYNHGKLKVTFNYMDYLKRNINDNENHIDIVQTLGIDPEKFWYLLLFVADYVEGSTAASLKCNPTPREEIQRLIDFVEANEDSVSVLSELDYI